MRTYFTQFENNTYLPEVTTGHGYDGWLSIPSTDPEGVYSNETLTIFRQLAQALGYNEDELFDRMRTDVNALDPDRDSHTGLFNQLTHHTPLGNRTNANILLESTLAARNTDN